MILHTNLVGRNSHYRDLLFEAVGQHKMLGRVAEREFLALCESRGFIRCEIDSLREALRELKLYVEKEEYEEEFKKRR